MSIRLHNPGFVDDHLLVYGRPLVDAETLRANESMGTEVAVLRTISELEQIRSAWTAWNCHPNSDMEFYLLLMEENTEIRRPHVIVAYRAGRPVAMLIGRIVEQRRELKIGYKTILRSRVRMLSIVHGGTLGDIGGGNSDLLMSELVQSLYRGEADIAVLNYIRTDSPLYLSAKRVPVLRSRDFFPTVQGHWRVCLGDLANRAENRASKDERELRRKGRKLLADHSDRVQIRCFRRTSELEGMIATIEEIAAKTYQRGLGVGFRDNNETRRMLYFEAEKGWLRAYVLYAGEKPCAYWIGNVYREVFHGGAVGFDPAFAKYAPGKYLMTAVMREFSKDGIKEVDFGLGDATYKQLFGNRHWEDVLIYLFAPTLKGLQFNALRASATLVERISSESLRTLGLLPKVKRLWRNRARQV